VPLAQVAAGAERSEVTDEVLADPSADAAAERLDDVGAPELNALIVDVT
jgi:hypothetical protein